MENHHPYPATKAWYKWLVLFGACLNQTFCGGYLNSTMAVMSIYYADRFGDRKIAGVIGTVQSGIFFLTALPAIYIVKRFGERLAHVVGGILVVAGVVATAFATAGWQALLGTGVVAGLGCSITLAAPYEILSKYFPGRQLVPFACMSFSYTIGVVISPQYVSVLMAKIGYTYALLCCCGTLSINIFAGMLFFPKEQLEAVEDDDLDNRSKFTLKIRGPRSGVYYVTSEMNDVIHSASTDKISDFQERGEVMCGQDSFAVSPTTILPFTTLRAFTSPERECTKNFNNERVGVLRKQDSTLSQVIARLTDLSESKGVPAMTSTSSEKQKDISTQHSTVNTVTVKNMITDFYGLTIGDLLDDTNLARRSCFDVMKKPEVLSFFIAGFFTTASFFSFNTVLGDYARNRLHFSDKEFAFGATVIGLSMLPFGIVYLLLTRYSNFSSALLHCIVLALTAVVMLCMLAEPSLEWFYLLMALYGMSRTFYVGNLMPISMEVSNPKFAVVTYMTEMVFEGVGGLTFPYLAAYLQVEVHMRYGMALSGCLMIVAFSLLIPIGIKSVTSPKIYTKCDEGKDWIHQTAYLDIAKDDSSKSSTNQQSINFSPIMHM